MMVLLILVFIVVPIAELYLILQVGDAIGAVPTILLLIADSLLGSMLLRSQGRSVWRQFNEVLAEGRIPHRELFDGIAVIFGGAFLITPGFLTDIAGLLLLIPPTRAVVRRVAVSTLGKRFGLGVVTGVAGRVRRPGGQPGGPEGPIEGTARERPDPPPQGRIEP
jgi:UPF0716 protein FxsA